MTSMSPRGEGRSEEPFDMSFESPRVDGSVQDARSGSWSPIRRRLDGNSRTAPPSKQPRKYRAAETSERAILRAMKGDPIRAGAAPTPPIWEAFLPQAVVRAWT